MKAIQCELCGATDIIKDGDLFVCQSCGMKYTPESAKKMMIEGTVDVQGTVKIDATCSVENFLDLSRSAIEAGNGEAAIEYANKALEIAPKDSRAWLLKMKAVELIATVGDLKLKDMLESGKNAMAFADNDELKAKTEEDVYEYYLKRALALFKFATNNLSDTADIQRTFNQLKVVNFLTASNSTLKIDSKFINLYDNLNTEAYALTSYVPDEALVQYHDLVRLLGECAKQYRYATNALEGRYSIYYASLADSSKKYREKCAQEMENRANIALEKRETEYFRNNPDALNSKIQALKKSVADKNSQIEEMNNLIASLSIFKSGEKGELRRRISNVQKEIKELESKIEKLENKKSRLEVQ